MHNEISLRHVFFASKGKILLENINVCFCKNQLTTLVGPNGGGKSTLLKLILGVEKPTAGQIKKRKGLKIGYMPQKISLPTE